MPEARYYLERSQQEAVRSIQASHPAAAAAHHAMCVRYVAQALAQMAQPRPMHA